ncbi:unnamed protein product, partial [Didymodactylos carnosus]
NGVASTFVGGLTLSSDDDEELEDEELG